MRNYIIVSLLNKLKLKLIRKGNLTEVIFFLCKTKKSCIINLNIIFREFI